MYTLKQQTNRSNKMSTSKQDRKFSRNQVAQHFNAVNRAVKHMDKRRKENSRKNKSWKTAI